MWRSWQTALFALPALPIIACVYTDPGFRAPHFADFGAAALTECRSWGALSAEDCAPVFVCVNRFLAENYQHLPSRAVIDEIGNTLPEFVYSFRIDDLPAQPEIPNGPITQGTRHLEYRIGANGQVYRWSSNHADWIKTGTKIQDVSVPQTLRRIIKHATLEGRTEDEKLLRLFLAARNRCFVKGALLK
jgi:hypothetical protein